ncbi:MAG: sigma-70 family RNA polymerase sigma factor [Bacteroidales bacterium]|nr:sigma-70 family RNA polymerase sigma factor [Bacteroidales bacterium]
MTAREYNIFVRDYSDNAYRFAYTLIKQREHARDIVQDVFMKLWEQRDNINKDKIKSWIFSSVYHKAIDELRKKKNFSAIENIKEVVYNDYSSIKEDLNKYLDCLPAVQKSALLLKDQEGCKYEEISEILHLSMQQVKVYIFRARKQMQQLIQQKDNII